MNAEIFIPAGACAAVLAVVLHLTGPDQQEIEQAMLDDYCSAVEQWHAMAAQGVDPDERFGHPDYKALGEHCPGGGYQTPERGTLAAN